MNNRRQWIFALLSLVWMAVIFAFSAQAHSGDITKTYLHEANVPVRKLGHMSEFALLSWLYFQALTPVWPLKKGRAALVAALAAVVWACLDEFHQSFVPGRSALFTDVLVDSSGIAIAMLLVWFRLRRLNY